MPKTPHTTPLVFDPAMMFHPASLRFGYLARQWPGDAFPVWRCVHRAFLDTARGVAAFGTPIEHHALVDACAYALMDYLTFADLAPRGWADSVEPTWQHLGHALHVWRMPDRLLKHQIITDVQALMTNAAAHIRNARREGSG
ncbi:hypothetical protein AB0I28_09705 [Phytomonospora sp. NPDC050363]|uniref:hypothetical protein n=1 Tax=Phytomonospora sp. NPDC050363 TaxID=3155642 RepID=UPI00341098C4